MIITHSLLQYSQYKLFFLTRTLEKGGRDREKDREREEEREREREGGRGER